MRILRLDLDDGEELDLHPYVTVLGGLAPDVHQRVVDRLVRLARGDAAGTSGLVEAHDVLAEVTTDAVAALGLPADADVLVRAEQLPGALRSDDTGAAAGPTATAAAAALAEVEAELAAAAQAVATLTAQLDDARRGVDDFAINAHDASMAAVQEAERAAADRLRTGPPPVDESAQIREQLVAARDAAAEVEAQLDAERLLLLEMLEDLENAEAQLADLRAAGDATDEVEPEPAPAIPSAEDVASIEMALAEVRLGPPDVPLVPSVAAVELADQIAEHNRRHDALEHDLRDEGIDIVGLQRQLAEAQDAVIESEVAARPKVISPADDAEIERLHDIVVEQGEKKDSRRGGKGAEVAWREASDALDALLERVGYPTYAAYVMGRISPSVDIDARRRLDEARGRVAEIEGLLDQAASVLERDARVLMLRAERDQLWAAARDMLGTLPDDVEGGLRSLRVPGEGDHPALDALRRLLDEMAIDRHGDTEAELVGAAEAFLADAALARAEAEEREAAAEASAPDDPPDVVVQRRIAALHRRASEADAALATREAEHERLVARVRELEDALASVEADAQHPTDEDPRIAQDPAVRAAREQLVHTEARLARHRDAVGRADQLQMQLREARSAERSATAARDVARAELDGPGATTAVGIDQIEAYLLDRASSVTDVARSGSVPLILDDAFRGLPQAHVTRLCATLARIGGTVQVLYVGDEPTAVDWARAQGLDVAAVVRPGQPAL